MKLHFLASAASGVLALTCLAPSLARAACDIDSAAQSAPALTSSNWYHRIDGAGNVAASHPDGYYQISAASMVERASWLFRSYRDIYVGTYNYRVRHVSAYGGKYAVIFEK